MDLIEGFDRTRAKCERRMNALVDAVPYARDDLTKDGTAEALFGEAIDVLESILSAAKADENHEVVERLSNAMFRLCVGYQMFDFLRIGKEAHPSLDWTVTADDEDYNPQTDDEFMSVEFDGYEDGKPVITHEAGMAFRSYAKARQALEACREHYPQYAWRIGCDTIADMHSNLNNEVLKKYVADNAKRKEGETK